MTHGVDVGGATVDGNGALTVAADDLLQPAATKSTVARNASTVVMRC
jgi:hypothetical protein